LLGTLIKRGEEKKKKKKKKTFPQNIFCARPQINFSPHVLLSVVSTGDSRTMFRFAVRFEAEKLQLNQGCLLFCFLEHWWN